MARTNELSLGTSHISRRGMLVGLSAAPLAHAMAVAAGVETVREAIHGNPGMVIREKQPENLESDFSALSGFLTPNEKFYVRNHFPAPAIRLDEWRFKIEGEVARPAQWRYDELVAMPSVTRAITLECAGNGRVFLTPKADGVQWQLGAVGTAEWTGVPLNALLDQAQLSNAAVDVIFEGADMGEPSKPSRPAKPFHYARSISAKVARQLDILLAYRMNGQELPLAHGYPLRAVVPGWFGMASVKWLSRIVISREPYQGYFQTVDYCYWIDRNGSPTRIPITELQVKSQIARPAMGESIAAGKPYRIFGAAWSGGAELANVEVSTDGGKTFSPARLTGEAKPNAWRLWEFDWKSPTRGEHVVMARASDKAGRTQPMDRDRNRETYMINHVLPTGVTVS